MTKASNEAPERSPGKLTPFDEGKLATRILTLISRFFAEGRDVNVGERRYVVISSDQGQPETESFIDVVGSADGPGRAVSRYAVILQKISS